MFSKQNLLATVAATVAMFVLGYLIWGMAMVDFYESHTTTSLMKEMPDFVFLIISHVIGSFALSVIYGKWAGGDVGAGSGFNFGIWIGIFAGISYALLWYATADLMDLTGHLVDGVVTMIFFGVVCAVIGWVHKATSPKAATS